MKNFHLLLCLLVLSHPVVCRAQAKKLRVLVIGNSAAEDATRFLKPIARDRGHKVDRLVLFAPRSTLQFHAELAGVGGKYVARMTSLDDELKKQWDFVTIQQSTEYSSDVDSYEPYATQLRDHIIAKSTFPKPVVLMHQTWAYRPDNPIRGYLNAPQGGADPTPENPGTRVEEDSDAPVDPSRPGGKRPMYNLLQKAYKEISAKINAPLIPVGAAFQQATEDINPAWLSKVDREYGPGFDNKPDEPYALTVGPKWDEATSKSLSE